MSRGIINTSCLVTTPRLIHDTRYTHCASLRKPVNRPNRRRTNASPSKGRIENISLSLSVEGFESRETFREKNFYDESVMRVLAPLCFSLSSRCFESSPISDRATLIIERIRIVTRGWKMFTLVGEVTLSSFPEAAARIIPSMFVAPRPG